MQAHAERTFTKHNNIRALVLSVHGEKLTWVSMPDYEWNQGTHAGPPPHPRVGVCLLQHFSSNMMKKHTPTQFIFGVCKQYTP